MSYKFEDWRNRYSERSDLSTGLVHLTRATDNAAVAELMFKILTERTLKGSSTEQGFIVGKHTAVCFQDAPLSSVCQNTWFEQKLRASGHTNKTRYHPCGFMFSKQKIYTSGGRPVIYDKTAEAKKYLPESEWWRIVNFDLSNPDFIIDWTHEREWRVKGDFEFDVNEVTLLFTKSTTYKAFIELCDKNDRPFYKVVAGVINMQNILF
ncbi:DUF2971 domain-containing protein [Vibrio crassostreae]|uniref:hypothetical protein n=1 Tax=Vibrio crassostreae TaxID=246167 RepID=UPI001BD27AA4|nr:hypothetical protein [Vibrio crassostreae]CAK1722493.1 DUF2971 domain-containing protein [Vibrio crassostreae]CAK1953451.1 DUF2971 domain-containing protein [Vibrio crassostreae]CAK1991179.1 DUF2971 domain-containing protein [Vibrio crassostreae]CAK2044647.1 DUF2971 domain-containing protein [Vibrio crassostreae]CAK2054353.1 DUF2971 domain-containing protein [Vibrio crassostreae]